MGRVKEENPQPMSELETAKAEEGGWEMARRGPVKRALHMTDFRNKETASMKPTDGKFGTGSSRGHEAQRGLPRDGKMYRKEGARKGAWEGHTRGPSNTEDQTYRPRDGSRKRGRITVWPTPLYLTQ